MKHSYHSIDDLKRSLINSQPHVEGIQDLCAKVLARQRHSVVKWSSNCLQRNSV